jgi:hypothetical protein
LEGRAMDIIEMDAASRELLEESGIKLENVIEVGKYENEDVCIHYFRSDVVNIEPVLQEEEIWSYEWVDPKELEKYKMMDNMRDNIVKILFPVKHQIITINKSFASGLINEEQKSHLIDVVLEKARLHKYIKKELKDGKWIYTYNLDVKDKDDRVEDLIKALNKVEKEIIKLDEEHSYVFDKNGKEVLKKTSKSKIDVRYVDSEVEKMEGCILTHNHPGYKEYKDDTYKYGITFSRQDFLLACRGKLKEIRCVSGEYKYSFSKEDGSNFELKDYPKFEDIFNEEPKIIDEYLSSLYKKGYKNDELNFMRLDILFKYISDQLEFIYSSNK